MKGFLKRITKDVGEAMDEVQDLGRHAHAWARRQEILYWFPRSRFLRNVAGVVAAETLSVPITESQYDLKITTRGEISFNLIEL